jgi:protein-L-isoaspartate(D-aspartate) O-methyltransferase
MEKVPRHRFIPPEGQGLAYEDHPVSIGHRQTISQPYIVAYMTQALSPRPGQRVLEIGTGSGYQAAVLSEVVGEVYTIEIVAPLGERARATLEALGHDNISFRIGDGYAGWPEAAPFDAIMLTAAPPEIPKPLLDQLAVGGVMIAPVGRGHQELIKIHRTPDGFVPKSVMGVRFVPMTGRAQQD